MLIPVLYLFSTILFHKEIYAQTFSYDDQFGGTQLPQYPQSDGSQSPQYPVNGGPQTPEYLPNGGLQPPQYGPNGGPQPPQYGPNGGPQFLYNNGQAFPTPGYPNGIFPYQGLIPPIFGDQSTILLGQPDPSIYSQGQPVLPFSLNYPGGNTFNGGPPVFIAGYPKPAHVPETPNNEDEKPKNTQNTENSSSGKKSEKLILSQENGKPANKNKGQISYKQNANLQPKQNAPANLNEQENANLEEQLRNYLLQKYREQVYKNNQRNHNNQPAYNNQESYNPNNGQRYVLLQNGENYQNPEKPLQNLGQKYFLNHDAYLKNQQSNINNYNRDNYEQVQGKSGALLQDVLPLNLHNQVINGKVQPFYLQRSGEINQQPGYYSTNLFQGGYNLYNLDRANSNIDEDSVVIDAKYQSSRDAEVMTEGNVGNTEKPAKSSLAQSQPDAVAIAGIGGVASAGPKSTALAGVKGLAVSSPKATAIANPTKEVDNEEIRFKL